MIFLRYSICIRQEEGFCCVEYYVCPDQDVQLPGAVSAPAGFSFDTTQANQNSRVDDSCRSGKNSVDHIAIPESSEEETGLFLRVRLDSEAFVTCVSTKV